MNTIEKWTAQEMLKRLPRILGKSISLETLDYELFKKENKKGGYFNTTKKAQNWITQHKKEVSEYLNELEYCYGFSQKDIAKEKKNPNHLVLLIANRTAADILYRKDNEDKDIPFETPSIWTKKLLQNTGFKNYL